ncbi:MAG TPA: translation initiation factor IF-2 [Gammaproteobacteria bacterium]|nr:translation initiation factor IF-2 [Gammaproteobacteria bacterium]
MSKLSLKEISALINTDINDLLRKLTEAGHDIKDTSEPLSMDQCKLLLTAPKSSTMKLKKKTTNETKEDVTIQVIKHKKSTLKLGKTKPASPAKKQPEKTILDKKDPEQTPIEDDNKKSPEVETSSPQNEPIAETAPQEDISENKTEKKPAKKAKPAKKTTLVIPEAIKVIDLAKALKIDSTQLVKTLMELDVLASINQIIDFETASILASEFGHDLKLSEEDLIEEEDSSEDIQTKSPIVTIMGHVDHGKTTLLDYLRKSRVASQEHGGITQHIGAYQVMLKQGAITFLDTPGHEAFTAMRARGSQITDIVILIVAADDSVKPQTIEAIHHARAAKVPMIVAISKIDKPDADLEKVRNDLVAQNVVPEDWGGDTIFAPFSAKTGKGIPELLDSILLQAEMLELSVNHSGTCKGIVLESKLDKGRGPVATLLIQSGSLKQSDILLAGKEFGKIRLMLNDVGEPIKSASPSMPVEILGLSGLPNAGDTFICMSSDKKAREAADVRRIKHREITLSKRKRSSLEDLFSEAKDKKETLNIILKTDTNGSLGALCDSLTKLSNDEVSIEIVGKGVGGINESDAQLANASKAFIFGFNVRADKKARQIIETNGTDLYYFSIIYDLINQVKSGVLGLMKPTFNEKIIGYAQVREVFNSSKFGAIAGCMVTEGILKRNTKIRVLRDNVVIFEGEIQSLRRFKNDTAEVRNGMECGIGVKNYKDIKANDQIEAFITEKVMPTLET